VVQFGFCSFCDDKLLEVSELDNKRDMRFWNVVVPKSLDDALEAAVSKLWHRTKTEFIREAVRRELERLGFKPSVGVDGADVEAVS
jgi:hypothetical protein